MKSNSSDENCSVFAFPAGSGVRDAAGHSAARNASCSDRPTAQIVHLAAVRRASAIARLGAFVKAISLGVVLLAGVAFAQHAPQRLAGEQLAPELEARVQALGKHLRCAVCQGLSITDSPSSMARAQLEKVRELVAEGKTDEEVTEYFVARYGEWVLLEPPAHGANWIVWLGPLMLIGVGGFVIFRQVRGSAPAEAAAKSENSPSPAPENGAEEDPYLRAVRAELEK